MKKSLTKHQEWKHQVVGMNCVSLTINDLFNLVFKALYCELTWIDGDVRVSVEERLVSFWFVNIMHYAFCKVRRLSEHLAWKSCSENKKAFCISRPSCATSSRRVVCFSSVSIINSVGTRSQWFVSSTCRKFNWKLS